MTTERDFQRKWAERLQRVMDAAPEGIWLYAASGTLHIMALDLDGSRMVTPEGGMDQDAIIAVIRTPEIDGGDW